MTSPEGIVNAIGYILYEKCREKGLEALTDKDYISLVDAHFIENCNVKVIRNKVISTVKRTSIKKYEDAFNNELHRIIEKFNQF